VNMDSTTKLKIVGASIAVVAVAGGGAALAATKPWSPNDQSQAVINDAAKQLGVSPAKLSDALKQAIENRVDAAVTAGLLTKAQGDELKKRIEASDVPFPFGFRLGLGPRPGLGLKPFFAPGLMAPSDKLSAAASYLGLSKSELATQLAQGKTLAQIAKDQGKSVDGLVNALVSAAEKRIDAAVSSGKLTKAQGDELKSDLHDRVTRLVGGQLRFRRYPFAPGFGRDFQRMLPFKPWSSGGFSAPSGPSA